MASMKDLIEGHYSTASYVKAVAGLLRDFSETEAPAGMTEAQVEATRAMVREAASILDTAAVVLADPRIAMTTAVMVMKEVTAHEEEEEEIRLTSRKVAQA